MISGRAGKGFWIEKLEIPEKEKIEMIKEEFLGFLEKAIEMGLSAEKIKELVDEFFGKEK